MINELEIYDMKLLEIEQRIHVFMKQSLQSSKNPSWDHCLHRGISAILIHLSHKFQNNAHTCYH